MSCSVAMEAGYAMWHGMSYNVAAILYWTDAVTIILL